MSAMGSMIAASIIPLGRKAPVVVGGNVAQKVMKEETEQRTYQTLPDLTL